MCCSRQLHTEFFMLHLCIRTLLLLLFPSPGPLLLLLLLLLPRLHPSQVSEGGCV